MISNLSSKEYKVNVNWHRKS